MKPHRLTPVQKRVLAFLFTRDRGVQVENGHKRTEFVNGHIVRCQVTVWYFLRAHGYVHEPNPYTNHWEITDKGIVAIGGCSESPTRTHVVGTAGICTFCKAKVARNLDRP